MNKVMKLLLKGYWLLFCLILLGLGACKSEKPSAELQLQHGTENKELILPHKLTAVLDAHGGLSAWNKKRAVSYDIEHKDDLEKHYVDIWDRRELIVNNDYNMGFDGENYWTDADTSVKANPIFQKNLMFYFYAMPFVLADNGSKYEEVPPFTFDGVEYPGFRISYESGIGVSPEDEYFMHYDAKTNQMAWLGYTVTYFSQEKSKKIKWIHYDDWQEIEGLKLPGSIMWYNTEENKPTEERSRRSFINVNLQDKPFADERFDPTPESRIVTE